MPIKTPYRGCFVQAYSNGDVYEGEFHEGKCSGSGVYYDFMSGRYEGDWVDGKYNGYGIETWARGSWYRGQYKQGIRHGFGVFRFFTGDVYAGEWSNGQSHGCGVHTCEDGSRYMGEFKWELNMALDTTITETGIHMLENIMLTRCRDLESIGLRVDIFMRELGMKVEDRVLERTRSVMEKLSLVIGMMGFLMFQARRTAPIPYLLLVSTTPKCLMQFRIVAGD